MSNDNQETEVTASTSAVWQNHITVPDTPDGFTLRTTVPANPDGVEVMLEQWEVGSEKPPHSHPGDDMTVVVEGKMAIQFFTRTADGLIPDGEIVRLNRGDTGYISAGRIHDAFFCNFDKLSKTLRENIFMICSIDLKSLRFMTHIHNFGVFLKRNGAKSST